MKAILVTRLDHRFVLSPQTRPSTWERLSEFATGIDDLGPLSGWGQWGHAYRVHYGDGAAATLFTERRISPPQSRRRS